MKIKPYHSVATLLFGESTKRDCIRVFGEPTEVGKNRDNELECSYPDFIVRFGAEDHRFRECTLLPRKRALISSGQVDVDVTWDQVFLTRLCEIERTPLEALGFLIFTDLGIAITGLHDEDESQLAITVFSEGDFDEFLVGSVPFDIDG